MPTDEAPTIGARVESEFEDTSFVVPQIVQHGGPDGNATQWKAQPSRYWPPIALCCLLVLMSIVIWMWLRGPAAPPPFPGETHPSAAAASPFPKEVCHHAVPGQHGAPISDPYSWMPEEKVDEKTSWKKVYVLKEHKLVFCSIAKSGSSFFGRLLRRMAGSPGGIPWYKNPRLRYNGKKGGMDLLSDLPDYQALEIMRSKDWTHAVVVRDPAERLLSVFLNKILAKQDKPNKLQQYSKFLYEYPVSEFENMPFETFVQRITARLTREEVSVDGHFIPQSSVCDLRNWLGAYDLIMWLTEYNGEPQSDLLQCLLNTTKKKSLAPDALDAMSNASDYKGGLRHASGANRLMEMWYTPSLLRHVVNAFAKDYMTFSLPVPRMSRNGTISWRRTPLD